MIYWYILILLFLFVVVAFWIYPGRHYRYQKRAFKLYEKLQTFPDEHPGKIIAYLRKISPYVFEELLLVAFDKKGYKTYENKRYSGDGGIDGRVKKDGQLYYIQAKRYKSHVNAKHVQAFANLCERDHVKGFFVHTGKTGRKSRGLAYYNSRIEIVSGRKLIELIKNRY